MQSEAKSNRRSRWPWYVLVLVVIVLAAAAYPIYALCKKKSKTSQEDVLKPLKPPINFTDVAENEWGSLRANLYFGLRMPATDSPLFGTMWYEQPQNVSYPSIRHWCNQDDQFPGYGWYAANGRTFGRQTINDTAIVLNTDWAATPSGWQGRVQLASSGAGVKLYHNYLLYVAVPNGTAVSASTNGTFWGHADVAGSFELAVDVDKGCSDTPLTSFVTDYDVRLDKLPDIVAEHTDSVEDNGRVLFRLTTLPTDSEEGQLAVVQVDVRSASCTIQLKWTDSAAARNVTTAPSFDELITAREAEWTGQFEQAFPMSSAWRSSTNVTQTVKYALANMLGGAAVFYGSNRVQIGNETEVRFYGPHRLYSAVPSRSSFPRGFLWDEGFHQLLISRLDPRLSLHIVCSWLNMMTVDGWIPREQILGVEAEARVPPEFIVQRPDVANPPSLFYYFDLMLQDNEFVESHSDVMPAIYIRLEKWYQWLLRTQAGPLDGTFRWRGRNSTTDLELNPQTLASGLDDYPRATHPTSDEYHLDLRCWMALASGVLSKLAARFKDAKTAAELAAQHEKLSNYDNLKKLHWSENGSAFADFGLHSMDVKLVSEVDPTTGQQVMHRVVLQPPTLRFVDDAFGYVSLFPLFMKLIPANASELGVLLDRLADPNELWTDWGLRSISAKSPYHDAWNTEYDAPYWRGNVWINANYLALSGLKYYAATSGPYQERARDLYSRQQRSLVEGVSNEFARTNYIWEHYDEQTGRGDGSHPFTGWSALVTAVVADLV